MNIQEEVQEMMEFSDEEYIQQDEIAEEYNLADQPDFVDEDEEPGIEQDRQYEFKDDSIQAFFEHKEPIYSVCFHPTNSIVVATGGGDDKSYVWAIDSGEKLFDLGVHGDSVSSVCFNFDGSMIASGGLDGKVFVFKTEDGSLLLTLEGPSEVVWLNWHPRGNVLLAGSEDGTIWMWQTPSGQCMNVFSGHIESVTCGQFTPDGKLIVSGSSDGSIIVWDPRTGQSLHKWTSLDGRFHQAPVTSISINPESTVIVSGAQDGSILLLKIDETKILGPLQSHTDSVETIVFSKVLPLLAFGSVDGNIHVFDTTTMKFRYSVKHDDAVTSVKFTPTEPALLVSASVDSTLKVWDARTGELKKTLYGHQNGVLDFAVRSDGKVVASASDDGVSLVFSLE